ncbi:MAG TPA: hypothetical protein VLG27_01925 [Candidatus Saccharimonadia bacterium]|nr:hypothetical protein [Candidatus Saccharimonadia bacterium]
MGLEALSALVVDAVEATSESESDTNGKAPEFFRAKGKGVKAINFDFKLRGKKYKKHVTTKDLANTPLPLQIAFAIASHNYMMETVTLTYLEGFRPKSPEEAQLEWVTRVLNNALAKKSQRKAEQVAAALRVMKDPGGWLALRPDNTYEPTDTAESVMLENKTYSKKL